MTEISSYMEGVGWDVVSHVEEYGTEDLCSPMKVNRCFEGKNCLLLEGRTATEERNQLEGSSKQSIVFS
jgi:hypothetical protein